MFDYDEVTAAAKKSFGIDYLFPWQRIVIANIMDAASVYAGNMPEDCIDDAVCTGKQIVLLPTGAGKSLCFLVPALLLEGATLVIYPLLALMSDQKRRMDEAGIESVVFRGDQSREERDENFRKIERGAKVIITNPETLQNEELVKRLSKIRISHIAVDEAHCVSEWGDSFRPSYLTLGRIIKTLGACTVTAFTATASPSVLARVSEVLFDGEAHVVKGSFDRPNIHYNVVNAYDKRRAAFRLAVFERKPLLIFCGTRAKSEDMARELSAYYGKDKVRFYHAGLTREEKTGIERWFYDKDDAVLCCTCAYGMGVDKKNIRTVIHLECPQNAEAYIQEAGRAARDGSIGKAILLWSPSDAEFFSKFEKGSRQRVMKDFAESTVCRRQVLLDALGGEQAVCDGCDVCERGKEAPFPEDAAFVLDFVRRHRKLYGREDLMEAVSSLLNRRDSLYFGMCIWEHDDVAEILDRLEKERFVRKCLWPWYGKIDCRVKKLSKIREFYYSAWWCRMQDFQDKTARTWASVKNLRILKSARDGRIL
ncbi:MAG: ATP-dependent DNA helicase RecQ [Treponema sp.]|nr:ATP-dependent DNA helicase RecQ [Treponema sp.]MBQ4236693.1 ATP-dependent DNA helicase RecQ [Treponema sp.]